MHMQFENGQRLPSMYDLLAILVAESKRGVQFVGLRILDKTSAIDEKTDFSTATIAGYHGFKAVPVDTEEVVYGDVLRGVGAIGDLPVEKIVFFQGEPVWHKTDTNGDVRVISKYEGALTRTLMFKGPPDKGLASYLQKRIDGGVRVKYLDFDFNPEPKGLVLPETLWDGEFYVDGFEPANQFGDEELEADARENIAGWLSGCRLTKSGRAVDDAAETDASFRRRVAEGNW